MRAGSFKIVHPTARRFGMAGATDEQREHFGFSSFMKSKYPDKAPPRDSGGTYPPELWAEYKAYLERQLYGGKLDQESFNQIKAENEHWSAYFVPMRDQTATGRALDWLKCSNKTAPTGVPNAFAQGACYVRNTGLVIGVVLGIGALFFVTKQIGD